MASIASNSSTNGILVDNQFFLSILFIIYINHYFVSIHIIYYYLGFINIIY